MSHHTLFEGNFFVLSYSAHIWNAYVAGNLLKIKNRKNEACLEQRQNKDKDNQDVAFREFKSTLKIGYNWLHICGVMLDFRFSATGGARKLMKPKHIFASPGKTEL